MNEVKAKGNLLGTCVPARYILAVLGSVGMGIVYGLKVNLSVALVGMLNHTAISQNSEHFTIKLNNSGRASEECVRQGGGEVKPEDGPFTWSEPLQGVILSCYFWGYFVSQIPGGRIAELFSAKWVMFFSVFINIICTLLTPVMANLHHVGVILMRIGEGIGGGVALSAAYILIENWFPPSEQQFVKQMLFSSSALGSTKAYFTGTNIMGMFAMHVLLSHWSPPAERGIMSTIVYAGTALGTVLSMLMAGLLSANLGWEYVFYVMGGLSCIWCVLWVLLIQDTPQKQKFIDETERNLIVSSLAGCTQEKGEKLTVPWKSVITSKPFWAILIAHTCSNWGWYMVLIELPFYMKQVLKYNITENSIITATPFLTLWIFSIALSKTLDLLKVKKIITNTQSRLIGTLIASFVPGVCLFALCHIGCRSKLAVTLMTIAVTSIGGMFCGFLSNHIDIAPNFAGTLMALTNTVATLPGIIVPIFVGYLTHGNQTISAWRVIFYVTVVLYIIEIIAYTLFGSGDEQPWNRKKVNNKNTNEDEEAEKVPMNGNSK